MNELVNKKEKIKIKIVLNQESNKELFEKIFTWSSDYLELDVSYIDNIENIKDIKKIISNVDFCFIHFYPQYNKLFAWEFYSWMHDINTKFKMIFVVDQFSEEDFQLFKNGGDDIIYLDRSFENLKWKFFSLLRRFWDTSHSKLTLIRNGVLVDLVKQKVIINDKEVNITKKEFQLLAILVEEYNTTQEIISKQKLYRMIYNDTHYDNTRVVDQLIFRLKRKLGTDFIKIEKNGIRII